MCCAPVVRWAWCGARQPGRTMAGAVSTRAARFTWPAVPEIQPGTELAVVGFTFTGEQGAAVLRAEYLFLGGKTYGMRSGPA